MEQHRVARVPPLAPHSLREAPGVWDLVPEQRPPVLLGFCLDLDERLPFFWSPVIAAIVERVVDHHAHHVGLVALVLLAERF